MQYMQVISFILKYYMQHILYLLELAACVIGFLHWKKLKGTEWQWFPFYLAIIWLVEITGDVLNYHHIYAFKNAMYNYFSIPLEFGFLYWLYYRQAAYKKSRQIIIICALVYVVSCALEFFYFRKNSYYFNSFSYCMGNLALLVAIIAFFLRFINSDAIIGYKTSMIFWVSLGALIFYLGSLPFYGLYNLLYTKYRSLFVFYSYIMYICNWVMYIFFSVAFIWGKPKYSSSWALSPR